MENIITIESTESADILVKGYQFDYLQSIFLSAANTATFPSTTAVNWFSNSHRVSAICPSFTGYQIPVSAYEIIDNNRLILSATFLFGFSGTLDVIFLNRAGYTKLSDTGYFIAT
jgi:hypothetical protein